VFLAICGGYQLLGSYYKTWTVRKFTSERSGLMDHRRQGKNDRKLCVECDFLKNDHYDGKIVGFENHSGRTYLGPGVKPLGKIIKGYGNNGEDGFEGAIYKNVYCSYSTEVCFQKPGLGRPSYFWSP